MVVEITVFIMSDDPSLYFTHIWKTDLIKCVVAHAKPKISVD